MPVKSEYMGSCIIELDKEDVVRCTFGIEVHYQYLWDVSHEQHSLNSNTMSFPLYLVLGSYKLTELANNRRQARNSAPNPLLGMEVCILSIPYSSAVTVL